MERETGIDASASAARDTGSPQRASGRPMAHGLQRHRLLELLRQSTRLALVIAPAGSGKTTLLSQHAATTARAISYRAVRTDVLPAQFSAGLTAAITHRPAPGPPADADEGDIVRSLVSDLAGALTAGPVTLLIDDVHLLLGSPSEDLLDLLLVQGPPELSIVLAARRVPRLNLCRAEVGDVTVIDADDLRFRSWEVETLFRDHYDAALPPDDVAALTRHTQGWAACLRLFHMSTRSRPLPDRRRAVAALTGGPRFARSYLARTVLEEIPAELRTFLSRTAVFEVLTARRCDELLGSDDAQNRLDQLHGLEALTTSEDGGRTFRYHEVLRRHLESALLVELGPDRTRAWYEDAACLLEKHDAPGEALRAFVHAERWDEVGRLLRQDGSRVIAEDPGLPWHETLAPELIDEDPWLSTAIARRLALEGRLAAAAARYRHAEALFPDAGDRERVGRERRLVELWTTGEPRPHLHWLDRLRVAVTRPDCPVPRADGRPTPSDRGHAEPAGQGDRLVDAATLLLVGDAAAAAAELAGLLEDVTCDGVVLLAARLLEVVLDALRGAEIALAANRLRADAEQRGATWIGRQAGVLHAFSVGDGAQIDRIRAQCEAVGDEWGALLSNGVAALRMVLDGRPAQHTTAALIEHARASDAGALQAWAVGLDALAAHRERAPDAADRAVRAEAFGRSHGVWAARILTVGTETTRGVEPLAAATPVHLRCFGGFALDVAGCEVDWRTVRPRAATVLRLLAARAPQPVHREELLGLWPDLRTGQATHSLQVAVSALRSLLAPAEPRGSTRMIRRAGHSYALVLPPGSTADVVEMEVALQSAGRARQEDRRAAEITALETALSLYQGDLLPEEGSADWVLAERDRWRLRVVSAVTRLAEIRLEAGDPAAAATAALRGLAIDSCSDPLWRMLIAGYVRTGDVASEARARTDYAGVLADLGLEPARLLGNVR